MRAIFSFFIDKWLHTYSILSLFESLKTIPKDILTFKPHIVKREKIILFYFPSSIIEKKNIKASFCKQAPENALLLLLIKINHTHISKSK